MNRGREEIPPRQPVEEAPTLAHHSPEDSLAVTCMSWTGYRRCRLPFHQQAAHSEGKAEKKPTLLQGSLPVDWIMSSNLACISMKSGNV